jgi:protein SCO1/2
MISRTFTPMRSCFAVGTPRLAPMLLPLLMAGAVASGCGPAAGARGAEVAGAPHATQSSTSASTPDSPVAVGEYSLYDLPGAWRDQRGDTLHLAALAGRVRVVAMVYTSCRATCPLIVADLKRIESAVAPAGSAGVGFVLVSLDPWRDTPGRLATWAAATGLDPARWTLLSGSDDSVRELAASLDVRYQSQPGGEIAHTNGLTVLDRQGRVAHQQTGLGDTEATIRTVRALLH